MTFRYVGALCALLVLAGCDTGGNPLEDPEDEATEGGGDGAGGGETPTDEGAPIDTDRVLPPGTASPEPRVSIFRREQQDLDDQTSDTYGNGFAQNFAYDSATDTFFVDGLAFDGSQPEGTRFARGVPGTLATNFALYEGPAVEPDFFSGVPIGQFRHRALYGISDSGNTEFAIVRTGSYIEYGFGGFIYQRNNGVELPEGGQASYSGDYAGIRDFLGQGGLEYVEGDMELDIDYGAFDGNCTADAACGNAVRGVVLNRTVYDVDGNDVTATIVDALDEANEDVTVTELPVLRFRIGPGVMDINGEATGEVFSVVAGDNYEEGTYYMVMSGDHNTAEGEIVGVVVVEADDVRAEDGITVRETGGFIVNRNE
ncbi:hypothetical protein [Cognatishimia sp. F0-27]|uniref:hypothetical protein n=1 Tax=Cognatishimia sp. F0-27 TaxID=2816855 RepID=UPI001D0C1121|nr:hypothetical protein [Cognatishimia sp. F0-27]MCC1494332.1 hypothetical protein [Cognatishimia sp. F0-27]